MDINQLAAETLKLSCELAEIKSILIEKGVCTEDELTSGIATRLSILELNLSTLKDDLPNGNDIFDKL